MVINIKLGLIRGKEANMKVTQVTFVAKNTKCMSIKPIRYFIDTVDLDLAIEAANELLRLEKHFERYVALTPVIIEIHNTRELK